MTEQQQQDSDDALEMAWGIIANAGGGNWETQTPDWQKAAARWRDTYMSALSARLASRAQAGKR